MIALILAKRARTEGRYRPKPSIQCYISSSSLAQDGR